MMQSTQTNTTDFSLSRSELELFQSQGFFGPFPIYSPEEMKRLWRKERLLLMDRSMSVYRETDTASGNTDIANYDRHLDSEFLSQHVTRPEIVDRLRSILGPDLLCWRSEFFPKHPGDEGTDWHQADTFANVSGTPQILWPNELKSFGGTITAWTAFTEADVDTACLQFIPGSFADMHYDETRKIHYRPERINQESKDGVQRGFFGYDYRELQVNPSWHPDERQAQSIVMKPGECVLFWSTLLHASHPHKGLSQQMRMGYACRYVPTCVRVYPDTEYIEEYGGRIGLSRYGAVLVSGENRFNHNRMVDRTTRGRLFAHKP